MQQRPKTQAMLFLLGAVLVGGVLGFTADRALLQKPEREPRWNQRAMREQLASDLRLSPDQKRVVDSILDARNEKLRAITAPIRPALDAVRDSARAAIRTRLSADQQLRWDAVLAEQERQRQGTGTAGGGDGR